MTSKTQHLKIIIYPMYLYSYVSCDGNGLVFDGLRSTQAVVIYDYFYLNGFS